MFAAGPADGSRGSSSAAAAAECSGAGGGDAAGAGGEEKGEVQVNGIATSPEEEEEELAVRLEDLPPVLNVVNPVSGRCCKKTQTTTLKFDAGIF